MGCSGSGQEGGQARRRKGPREVRAGRPQGKPFFELDESYDPPALGATKEMHVRHIKDDKELYEVEIMLFVEAMVKEVEVNASVRESFEQRVARELSNDKGERMIGEVGFLLVQEFRKFMYRNAVEILKLKWNGGMDPAKNSYNKRIGWCFEAPLSATYYIDQVWKNIMKYPGYRAYCENLCGGFIDRPDPATSSAFESAKKVSEQFWQDPMTQGLRAVWPKYGSKAEHALDFTYQVYAHSSVHEDLLAQLAEELTGEESRGDCEKLVKKILKEATNEKSLWTAANGTLGDKSAYKEYTKKDLTKVWEKL